MIENYTLAGPREITECYHLYTIPIRLVNVAQMIFWLDLHVYVWYEYTLHCYSGADHDFFCPLKSCVKFEKKRILVHV